MNQENALNFQYGNKQLKYFISLFSYPKAIFHLQWQWNRNTE